MHSVISIFRSRRCPRPRTRPNQPASYARLALEPLEDRRLLAVMSFQDGGLPTPAYDGARDAPVFGAEPDTNFGEETTLRADAEQSSSGMPVWSLLKWDLSHLPRDVVVNDVTITVNVTNTTSALGFHLFDMKTAWLESEVTWNGPTSVSTWEEPGPVDQEDVGATVLGTMAGTTSGTLQTTLNADGRAIVQRWVSEPSTNLGFLLANDANDNSLRFDSREVEAIEDRPMLTVDFSDVTPPTITLINPPDDGPGDLDPDAREVRVGLRDTFQFQLNDFALDDASVVPGSVAVTRDGLTSSDLTFSFDGDTDVLTLTPDSGVLAAGNYRLAFGAGDARIADTSGNVMPPTVFDVEIDESLPTRPVAVDDAFQTNENATLDVDAIAGVLDNDFDGNDQASVVLSVSPEHGTLTLRADGSFSYIPENDFFGQDRFVYIVHTPLFNSLPATVTLEVGRQSPDAAVDRYETNEEFPLAIDAAAGVLGNDSDPQNESLIAVLVRDARHGALTLNPDGSFSYVPEGDFFGADSFRYVASDGRFDSLATTVTLTVHPSDDPPVAADDSYRISGGHTFTIPATAGLLANDLDVDGDSLSVLLLAGPANGTLEVAEDGSFVYRANAGFEGLDQFEYTASDGNLSSNAAMVVLDVVGAGDLAVDDSYELAQDRELLVDVASGLIANDGPRGERYLSAVQLTPTSHGTVRLRHDGSFRYAADEGFSGLDGFDYGLIGYDTVPIDLSGEQKIIASDSNREHRFGAPVAVSGDTMVVGVRSDDEPFTAAGAIYIYDWDGDRWVFSAKMRNSVNASTSSFGQVVAIDGDTIVVGTPEDSSPRDAGAIYVFERIGGTWTEQARLRPSNVQGGAKFGTAIAVDGTRIVVGAPREDGANENEGAVYVFERKDGVWQETGKVAPAQARKDAQFGQTVDLFDDLIAVAAPRDDALGRQIGAVYAFERRGAQWIESARLVPDQKQDGYFGLALSIDDETIVVGHAQSSGGLSRSDTVYVFAKRGDQWSLDTKLVAPELDSHPAFGESVDISGGVIVVASPSGLFKGDSKGSVSVFVKVGSTWMHSMNVQSSDGVLDDGFGAVAAVSGRHFVVSSQFSDGPFQNTGAVYAYPLQFVDTASVQVSVDSQANAPPDAQDDSYSVDEDMLLTIAADAGLLANDSDPEGETLAAVIEQPPLHGTATFNPDGSFTYRPDENFFGTDEILYRANDAGGSSAPTRVSIQVSPINDPPVAVADRYEVEENTALVVDSALQPSIGPRVFESAPATAPYDRLDISITALRSAGARFQIVEPTRIGLAGAALRANTLERDRAVFATIVALSGPEDFPDSHDLSTPDVVGRTRLPLPERPNSALVSNHISIDLLPGWYALMFGTDGLGSGGQGLLMGSGIKSFEMFNLTAEQLGTIPDRHAHFFLDSELAPAGVLGNDNDVETDSLSARLIRGPEHGRLAFNSDGTFVYTPDVDFLGSDSFTYAAADGELESNISTVTLDVVPADRFPNAVGDHYTVDEDTVLQPDADEGVLANDSDGNNDALTAILVTGPQHGTLTFNGDGSFIYEPTLNFVGVDGFAYHATDGRFQTASTAVSITVTSGNDAPVAFDESVIVARDEELFSTTSEVILSDAPDGYWRFDEATGASIATDSSGNENHGTYVGEVGLESLGATNLPADKAVALDRDADHVALPSSLLDGATDLTIEFWFNTTQSGGQTVISAAGGEFPADNELLIYFVDDQSVRLYTGAGPTSWVDWTLPSVADGQWHQYVFVRNDTADFAELFFDGQSLGKRETPLSALSIASGGLLVGEEQDIVGGRFDEAQAMRGILDELAIFRRALGEREAREHFAAMQLPGGVLHNDTDVEGDPLSAILVDDVQHGTLALAGDGTFSYQPQAGFVGDDSFTYQSSDGQLRSNTATVTIQVNGPPVAGSRDYAVAEDQTLVVTAGSGVLVGDIDPNDDVLSAILDRPPEHGELVLNLDGSFEYTPEADFFGDDRFDYRAGDGQLVSAAATVTITVQPESDSPVAADDLFTVPVGGLFKSTAPGVLANDVDVDGDPLNVVLVEDNTGAALTLNSDGSFEFFAPQQAGIYTFTYRSSDGRLDSGVATVTLDVRPASHFGRIEGFKWHDLDQDGGYDPQRGESALAGWSIYLDLNENGRHDPGEPTTVTDANGRYAFEDLAPRQYVVAEINRPGWEQTFPAFEEPTLQPRHTFDLPSNPFGDRLVAFGDTLVFAGDDVLIGAKRLDSSEDEAGAVFLFDGITGERKHTFFEPTPSKSSRFGFGIIATETDIVIGARVGISLPNAVYVFDRITGQLRLTIPTPSGSDDAFGLHLAESSNRLLVGATGVNTFSGVAYLFDLASGMRLRTLRSPTPTDRAIFGQSVAFAGNDFLIGSRANPEGEEFGTVYMFDGNTGNLLRTFGSGLPWRDDGFADSITVSDGYLFVGAPKDNFAGRFAGRTYQFEIATGELVRTYLSPAPFELEHFGEYLSVSDGRLLVGAEYGNFSEIRSAAYMFDARTGSLLHTFADPMPEIDNRFATAVAASDGGVLIGAFGQDDHIGAAYLYDIPVQATARISHQVFLTSGDSIAGVDFGNLRTAPISDLTDDGFVDFKDLTVLLSNWNKDVSARQGNLIDRATTTVNFADLTFLLAQWTGPGPAPAPPQAAANAAVGPFESAGSAAADDRLRATESVFDRIGRAKTARGQAVLRREPAAARRAAAREDSPLRRLQAADVDRAMQLDSDAASGRFRSLARRW